MVGEPIAYVMAGGKGSRLYELTDKRAKPAVRVGPYRIVDFVLNNLYNSNLRKMYVLTQYNVQSLHRHLQYGWMPRFGIGSDEFLEELPASQSKDDANWYQGTADSIFQQRHFMT